MPSPEPLLAARGLGRRFGPSTVLRGVDLDIAAGQVLLVLGENGSGKTTLLRLLAGLLRPTTGSVLLHGQPVRSTDAEFRRHLGLLSHKSHMYDDLTLRENLVFAARMHGLADPGQAAAAAIHAADLDQRGDSRLGSLSRGMLQRAAIARAFIHRPGILLLDEPFTALDAPSADRVRRWIQERVRDGCGIALVTHQPAEVWELTTDVGVLAAGRWAILEPRPAALESFLPRYREAIRV
jgi:heme ABC exporter ATP-binding subunit CcmA